MLTLFQNHHGLNVVQLKWASLEWWFGSEIFSHKWSFYFHIFLLTLGSNCLLYLSGLRFLMNEWKGCKQNNFRLAFCLTEFCVYLPTAGLSPVPGVVTGLVQGQCTHSWNVSGLPTVRDLSQPLSFRILSSFLNPSVVCLLLERAEDAFLTISHTLLLKMNPWT